MICTSNCKFGTCTTIGVFLSLFGSIFVVYWPVLFDNILNKELALTTDSTSFGLWEVTPIPMYIEFYFFNWTNSEDIRSKNKTESKPILNELGPYVFREHRRKVIKGWNSENETVTFLQNRTWIYEPSLSTGSLDDVITTINIPAITAAFSVRNDGPFIKMMLNNAMKLLSTEIVVHKKVREFIFEGYRDKLLDLAKIIPPQFVPVSIPFDKFGWFYTRNGSATYDGLFNMFTGVGDIQKIGSMGNWNHENRTSYYDSFCGYVNGSAGEFFPPKREKTSISLFSPDVCRTLTLNYKEEVEVEGIRGYRFWGDDTMFDNQTTSPDNWCFCPSGDCAPNGAIDVSTCKWGAPAFISFPHFYHADPYYRESVVGMKPEVNKHQMFIDLEPRTGIPLQVAAALQINILMQPMPEFSLLRNLPRIYFPTIWFKQTAKIDDEIRPQLKLLTMLPPAGTILSFVFLSLGVTILLVVGIFFITVRCRKDEDSLFLKSIFGVPQRIKRLLNALRLLNARMFYSSSPACFAKKEKIEPEPIIVVEGEGERLVYNPNNDSGGEIVGTHSINTAIRRLSQVGLKRDSEETVPLYDNLCYNI